MPDPRVTVACRCGERTRLELGAKWVCESCGLRWDTSQIPTEEYAALTRDMRRARLTVIGVAAGITALFSAVALLVSTAIFLLVPVVLAGWFIVYLPLWRRRLRRRARELPAWDLRPL